MNLGQQTVIFALELHPLMNENENNQKKKKKKKKKNPQTYNGDMSILIEGMFLLLTTITSVFILN